MLSHTFSKRDAVVGLRTRREPAPRLPWRESPGAPDLAQESRVATYTIPLGSTRAVDGRRIDRVRTAQLDGDRLAVREETINEEGTRGFTETLYYTTDRRLIVHVANWSRLRGERVTYSMLEITGSDLAAGGRFEVLGRDAWAWLRV